MKSSTIQSVQEKDLPAVADFVLSQKEGLGPSEGGEYLARLRWLMLANPERLDSIPFGWMLLDERENIVGTQLQFPQRFRLKSNRLTALVSNGSFASRDCRKSGQWGFLFNEFRKNSGKHPLLATTANSFSAPFFKKLGGQPISGWDFELVTVVRPLAVWREFCLRRRGANGLIPEAISEAQFARECEAIVPQDRRIETVNELTPFVSEDEADNEIRSVREFRFLQWRYFHKPGIKPVLLKLKLSAGDVALAVQCFYKGRKPLRAMKILDVFTASASLNWQEAVRELRRLFARRLDCIIWRPGFCRRHKLSPLGTFRWKLDSNSAWVLDPKQLGGKAQWRLTYADGDAAL